MTEMKPLCTRLLLASLAAGVLVLAGACSPSQTAKPTGYEKTDPVWGSQFGYRDQRISPDEYSVIVSGTPSTPAQQVADVALLRAAHITRENGGRHFVVRDAEVSVLSSDETVSAPILGLFLWFPVARRSTEEPLAVLLFEIVREGDGSSEGHVLADTVIETLSEKLAR